MPPTWNTCHLYVCNYSSAQSTICMEEMLERGSESLPQGGSGAQLTPETGSGMVFWVIPVQS